MLRLCSHALFVIAILVGVFGSYGAGNPTDGSLEDDETDRYWTEERLNNAKSLESDEETREDSDADTERNLRRKRLVEAQYLPTKSVGKLSFVTPNGNKYCVATVVTAPSKSLLITSADCLYNRTTKAYNKNFVFTPAEDGGDAPLQKWPVKRVNVTKAYLEAVGTDSSNEAVGFAIVKKIGSKAVADVTGSQKISFSKIRSQFTYLFGYSSAFAEGSVMGYCLGKPLPLKCGSPTDPAQSLRCGFPAAIGSPWIEKFNPADGIGTVTSVTTDRCPSPPYFVNGPFFSSHVKALYDSLKSQT